MRQRIVNKTEEVRETERQPRERKVLSATARQGEIILDKYGRWLWVATFVVALVFLIFGL